MADTRPSRIDARGPRFAATITAALLVVTVLLSLTGISTTDRLAAASPGERALDPGFLALAVVAALFLWSVAAPRTAPWGVLFRRVVQPRLKPATEFEDPRPPRFAQGVGLTVTVIGLVLHLAGVPWALPIAASAAFIAAFLNAFFGLCIGCQMYLGLQRLGIIGRTRAA